MKKPINNTSQKSELLKRILLIVICCIFFTGNAVAQDIDRSSIKEAESSDMEFRHALNMCPVAVVFGIYAANYEYIFAPRHGIVIRYEYESIPKKYTDANIESSGMAFVLNYRLHRKEDLKSAYLGAFARYRIYNGNGSIESQDFDFTRKDVTLGLNVGKRWIWNNGFNINFMLGYGYSIDDRNADPSSNSIEASIDDFENDYDFLGSFLGEFSIGYAF